MLLHVRYDEISLKGGKRPWYEKKLRQNIASLLELPAKHIEQQRGRIVVRLPDERDPREALAALSRTFGVASASVVQVVEKDDQLTAAEPVAVALARKAFDSGLGTFKVETRRADKRFHLKSQQVSAELGARILEAIPQLKVDVHQPRFVVYVEVRSDGIALYADRTQGPGGVPVSTGGRGLCLLSGGIDSPVAAWHALKRGLHVDYVYYHAFPYTGDKAQEKVLSLARALSRWTPRRLRVHVASTTRIQDAIAGGAPDGLRIVLLRRAMYRIARKIAAAERHQALITGEAVGQVASQTLENLLCVEAVVPDTLVLRPLVGFDKMEIVARAEQIGTYETSILPFQDCCSLFAPSRPSIRTTLEECEQAEANLELDALEEAAFAEREIFRIERGGPIEQLTPSPAPSEPA